MVLDLRAAGLSDIEIRQHVGCSQSAISMWGTGERAKRTSSYLYRLVKLHDRVCGDDAEKEAAA